MTTRLLLIDDDKLITEPLADMLKIRGYDVLVANDGRAGYQMALRDQPDLVVLDILMPEMDGWEVCRALRRRSVVPILMLTALNDEFDRIAGLEMGADDYLAKPFSRSELLARIRALLRRVQFDTQMHTAAIKQITIANIVLTLDSRIVTRDGEQLTLRHKEFELLTLLMSRAGEVVTRAEIFDRVWGTDWLGDTRTLDVHIRWLREKLEEEPGRPVLIKTVRGVGYRFENQV